MKNKNDDCRRRQSVSRCVGKHFFILILPSSFAAQRFHRIHPVRAARTPTNVTNKTRRPVSGRIAGHPKVDGPVSRVTVIAAAMPNELAITASSASRRTEHVSMLRSQSHAHIISCVRCVTRWAITPYSPTAARNNAANNVGQHLNRRSKYFRAIGTGGKCTDANLKFKESRVATLNWRELTTRLCPPLE
jgi:hypothetical protein